MRSGRHHARGSIDGYDRQNNVRCRIANRWTWLWAICGGARNTPVAIGIDVKMRELLLETSIRMRWPAQKRLLVGKVGIVIA